MDENLIFKIKSVHVNFLEYAYYTFFKFSVTFSTNQKRCGCLFCLIWYLCTHSHEKVALQMTKFGKRKSHGNSGYKRERESDDTNNKMSPTNSFVHQLVKVSESAKEGDKFYAVTPLKKNEKLPRGSLGCYTPENREDVVDTMTKDIESLKVDVGMLKQLHSDQLAINAKLKQNLDKCLLVILKNKVVQLVRGLCHAEIILTLGITSPSRELLYFDQVVKTLDSASKSRLTNDPTYKQLRYISGPLFKELVDDRNVEVHPKLLDVDEVESMISEIELGSLSTTEKYCFKIIKTVIKNIKDVRRLHLLLDTYNQTQ